SATQINCGAACYATYDWSTVVTLSAAPKLGSVFLGWSGCDAVSGSRCLVTMQSAKSMTAVEDSEHGRALPDKGSSVNSLSPHGLNAGYPLLGWPSGCSTSSSHPKTPPLKRAASRENRDLSRGR